MRAHTALKRSQGQWAVFDDGNGAGERFPAAMAALEPGSASILRMTVGGVYTGSIVQFHRPGGSTVLWRGAWEPTFHRLGVGHLLTEEAVRRSAERGERTAYLGPGEEAHKDFWANQHDRLGRIRRHRSSIRSLAGRVVGRLTHPLRRKA